MNVLKYSIENYPRTMKLAKRTISRIADIFARVKDNCMYLVNQDLRDGEVSPPTRNRDKRRLFGMEKVSSGRNLNIKGSTTIAK